MPRPLPVGLARLVPAAALLVVAACAPAGMAPAAPAGPADRLEDLRLRIHRPLATKGQPEPTFTRAEADALFARHDADGDGHVTPAEWERLHAATGTHHHALDHDADGALQPREFHAHLLGLPGTAGFVEPALTPVDHEGLLDLFRRPGLAVVAFHARWNSLLDRMAPALNQLADDYADRGVGLYGVDVDDDPASVAFFSIPGVPTLLFIRDGKIVNRLAGLTTDARLKALIDEAL